MRVHTAYLAMAAPVFARTMTTIRLGSPEAVLIDHMEWLPQGLLIVPKEGATIAGQPARPQIIGHANIKSAELLGMPEGAPAAQPPVDNEHVAPGAEPFSPETIAAAKRAGKGRASQK